MRKIPALLSLVLLAAPLAATQTPRRQTRRSRGGGAGRRP